MTRAILDWMAMFALVMLAFTGFVVSLDASTESAAFDGRPKFSEGEGRGYYLWRDGDTWHVRWTTFGGQHRFTGRVHAEGGDLKALKRVDVDAERRVVAPGRPPHVAVGPRGRAHVVGGRPARVAVREEDHIQFDGDRAIRFTTRTDDDIDGFDFKVTDGVRVLRFNLEIDGAPRPAEIEIGKRNFKPREDPLVVHLR